MSGFVEPVLLTGQSGVSLEPLREDHVPEIEALAADGELGGLWFTAAPKAGAAAQWVAGRLAAQTPHTGLTFVVRDRSGAIVDGTPSGACCVASSSVPSFEGDMPWKIRPASDWPPRSKEYCLLWSPWSTSSLTSGNCSALVFGMGSAAPQLTPRLSNAFANAFSWA